MYIYLLKLLHATWFRNFSDLDDCMITLVGGSEVVDATYTASHAKEVGWVYGRVKSILFCVSKL